MNWKEYCKGFAIQKTLDGCDWEGKSLIFFACKENIPYKLISNINQIPDGYIPSGSVNWVESILGRHIKPDYFPKFLKELVKRKIWYSEKWPLEKVFIKPATKYKKFNGFITTGTYRGKKRGPFICSEIVSFNDEFRYYISYGEILGGYWYCGKDDIPKTTPKLEITIPSNWCGTIDVGILSNGDLELVECHHPFACGWYGKNNEEHAKFVTLGWKYLINKEYKSS